MLILTLRPKECIIIGDDDIRINFLNVIGNQIRLGFDADPNIKIFREAIFNRDREKFKPKHYPFDIKEHVVNGNRVDKR